ncbi:MAG TPA: M23 family peptidase, partial [Acinetobacter sp.]|nr:M23 family peptidase [Acinetobacter sp.]
MHRSISQTLVVMLVILLSACASTPKKPTPLPNAQVNKLKNMRLNSRLPVPVKGISRSELRDTWGAAR